jgi:hypothetical protein
LYFKTPRSSFRTSIYEFGKLCMGVFKNVVMLLPSFHFHKLNVN